MSSPWHFFFNDLPLSAAKPFVDACGETYYVGPMHLISEKWRQAPITALLCKKDNAVPLKRQESMWKWLEDEDEGEENVDEDEALASAADIGVDGSVEFEGFEAGTSNGQANGGGTMKAKKNGLEYIDACHTPWVSRAQEVANFLMRVLGREDVTPWMTRVIVRGGR
jgi:hypothetical protein